MVDPTAVAAAMSERRESLVAMRRSPAGRLPGERNPERRPRS
jgi:hypothetical protein